MDDESAVELVWVDYALLQEQIRKRRVVDHKSWALEEKADAFLKAVAEGSLPVEIERRERWLNNLETNRQKKYRNRSRILQERSPELKISLSQQSPDDRLIQIEQLIVVSSYTTAQEFRILRRLSVEHSYQAIAEDEQIYVGALKTKVCRCRQRLRAHLAA